MADISLRPPTSLSGNLDPNTHTGTQISGGKVASDTILLDIAGKVLGSIGSPLVSTDIGNSLVLAGQSFVAASPAMTLSLSGNLRMLLSNPAGSGVNVIVSSISAVNSLSQLLFANFLLNPTTGLPSTAGTIKNALYTTANNNNTSHATFTIDTSVTALSGGSVIFPIAVPQGRNVYDQANFILQPGVSVGVNIPFLVAAIGQMVVYFSEVSI